ncbi:MAG TPA: sulfotransferase family 2 domain-containing protein, partial [Myxococcota bacterium]|nr:sulfotransferase family 2 domain-containing protein [Myxococcota bacterium]
MLIIDDPRVLFIHIQKTGGTSVTARLRDRYPTVATLSKKHSTFADATAALGDEVGSYRVVTFVRNPWERLVSWYSMIVQRVEQAGSTSNGRWLFVLERARTFEEFIMCCDAAFDERGGYARDYLTNQLDYLADAWQRARSVHVGRYEAFADDARRIFDEVGLPLGELPVVNGSQHEHYSVYYSARTRDIVAKRYRRDIDAFGYTFAGPPTHVATRVPVTD